MAACKILRFWCPHPDSNGDLLLRTELFYPLNYGGIRRQKPAICEHNAHARLFFAALSLRIVGMGWLVIKQFCFTEPVSDLELCLFGIS